MASPASRVTVTEDLANCPQCGAVVTKVGRNDRLCNTCGLTWTLVTEEDELNAEADRLVRSRAFNEERGRGKKIGKFQSRW